MPNDGLQRFQTSGSVQYGILHNVEDSEDAVHQAFLTIAEHFDKVKKVPRRSLPSYIVIITKRISIDIDNKNKRDAERLSELDDDLPSVDADVLAKYEYELLLDVISELSDNYKEILYLYYINGFSTKEISKMLDISADNVWKRIERAKKQLMKKLEEDGKNV